MSQVYFRGDHEPLSSLSGLRLAHGAKTAHQGQALTGAQRGCEWATEAPRELRGLDPPAPHAVRMPVGSEGKSDWKCGRPVSPKGRRAGLSVHLTSSMLVATELINPATSPQLW